jgi:hypothetical protein
MTDKEKLKEIKKLADSMYYAAMYLTTDASRLHKAMDEYHKFIIHEWREEPVSEQNLSNVERTVKNWKEPVSEDLEEAANDYGIRQGAELKPFAIKFFKAGAKWQCEQMMKDAVDGLVYAQLTTSGEIMIRSNYFKSETLDYLDNVKLIIIKEDKV